MNTKPRLADDCFAHDGPFLTFDAALDLLERRVNPVAGTKMTALDQAAGRILAEAVIAPRPIPAFDNSAVDGYAFSFADYDTVEGARVPVSARAAAGHPVTGRLDAGTAARIFTGAVIPEGCDTIVMEEDTQINSGRQGETVFIPPGLRKGANRRRAGEDVEAGTRLLEPPLRLRPQELAAIASTGTDRIRCYRPLRVAIFSTGDEIIRPGREMKPGGVYDANAVMLLGLLKESGVDATDLGILPDEASAVRTALQEAALSFDLLLTSGGVSRGEEDHVVRVLGEIGRLHLWRIAIKPGRPLSFGQIGDCVMLGLPGNPVAVFVCFLLFVWPVMTRLAGNGWPVPRRYVLEAGFDMPKKKTGRREFLRGVFAGTGRRVERFNRDGSGLISSLREADGLIEIGEDVAQIKRGEDVNFIPFAEFGLRRF